MELPRLLIGILFVLASIIASPRANAADERGGYTVNMMIANLSCGAFLGDYSNADFKKRPDGKLEYRVAGQFQLALGYVLGMMAGTNRSLGPKGDWFDELTTVDAMGWVASYCRDNPTSKFIQAVDRLVAARTGATGSL